MSYQSDGPLTPPPDIDLEPIAILNECAIDEVTDTMIATFEDDLAAMQADRDYDRDRSFTGREP